MPGKKQNKAAVHLTLEQERALRLLNEALNDITPAANIQDISEYPQTEHYVWRHWAERRGKPRDRINEPSTAWAMFRENLPHDVILKMQANFSAGASWTEVSLLPISVLFLNAWRSRLSQRDGARLFNINNEAEYEEAVDILTFRQLRNFLLLLPVALYEMWAVSYTHLTLPTTPYV